MVFRIARLLALSAALSVGACATTQSGTVVSDSAAASVATVPGVSDTTTAVADTVDAPPLEVAAPQRPRPGSPQVIEIDGPEALTAGERATYRVRLAPGAHLPVHYRWDFGDGTAAIGNSITAHFEEAGIYWLQVATRNQIGRDTATVRVEVTPRTEQPVAEQTDPDPGLPPAARRGFGWVVASGLSTDEAADIAQRYHEQGFDVSVHRHVSGILGDTRYVAVGAYETEAQALAERRRVAELSGTGLWLVQRGGRQPR